MPVTALYASLLACLFIYLSMRVIGRRRQVQVEIGPGQDPELFRRMRVHANFTEYVPFALIVLALAESLKAPALWLHTLGIIFVMGRLFHAYALSQTPHILKLRTLGMLARFAVIGLAALICFIMGGIQIVV